MRAGYTRRRKDDNRDTDRAGNANLVAAAKHAGTRRFVLNSILQCDDAPGVSHFEDKAAAEVELRRSGVPFVSLRPGAFFDQSHDFVTDNLSKGLYMGFGDRLATRWSWVYTPDLAESLVAAALADDRVVGRTIDVGWSDGPVSNQEMADALAVLTGRAVKTRIIPWWLLRAGTAVMGIVKPTAAELGRMFLYFRTGRYVANPTAHEALLGPLPTRASALQRWAQENRLATEPTGGVARTTRESVPGSAS